MAINILIANQKGGSGKTTLARELYFSFKRTGDAVSYIDLDTQAGDTSQIDDHAIVNVIDNPGALTSDLGDLMESADLVIIPTRMTARDLPVLQTMMELADKRAQCPILYVLTCWNRFKAATAFLEVFDSFHVDHNCIIPNSEGFAQASAYDCSVTELYPRDAFVVTATLNFVNHARRLAGLPAEQQRPGKATN